jgi:hypothetical protein
MSAVTIKNGSFNLFGHYGVLGMLCATANWAMGMRIDEQEM